MSFANQLEFDDELGLDINERSVLYNTSTYPRQNHRDKYTDLYSRPIINMEKVGRNHKKTNSVKSISVPASSMSTSQTSGSKVGDSIKLNTPRKLPHVRTLTSPKIIAPEIDKLDKKLSLELSEKKKKYPKLNVIQASFSDQDSNHDKSDMPRGIIFNEKSGLSPNLNTNDRRIKIFEKMSEHQSKSYFPFDDINLVNEKKHSQKTIFTPFSPILSPIDNQKNLFLFNLANDTKQSIMMTESCFEGRKTVPQKKKANHGEEILEMLLIDDNEHNDFLNWIPDDSKDQKPFKAPAPKTWADEKLNFVGFNETIDKFSSPGSVFIEQKTGDLNNYLEPEELLNPAERAHQNLSSILGKSIKSSDIITESGLNPKKTQLLAGNKPSPLIKIATPAVVIVILSIIVYLLLF